MKKNGGEYYLMLVSYSVEKNAYLGSQTWVYSALLAAVLNCF